MRSSIGKQVVFVTNNSTKSRLDYKKKLDKLGVPATHVSAPIVGYMNIAVWLIDIPGGNIFLLLQRFHLHFSNP